MKNSHLILVKYLSPTNTRGAKIELSTYDVSTWENRHKKQKIILKYDYALDIYQQSQAAIESAGLEILGMNARSPGFIVYLTHWNHEAMCKLFKVKNEV